MNYSYFGIHRWDCANHGGHLRGENPSFPNKYIIRISGVFLVYKYEVYLSCLVTNDLITPQLSLQLPRPSNEIQYPSIL